MKPLLCLVLLLAFAVPAQAGDSAAPPAIVYAQGAKFDKSFNEAAYNGAERFKAETGIAYHEVEITNDSQRVQALSALIRRGAPVVVAVGFDQRAAVETVAERFPEARLVIIDTVVDKPNVQSVVFREQEGAFLVGILGAMASKSGTIGYLGGMDIPISAASAGAMPRARAGPYPASRSSTTSPAPPRPLLSTRRAAPSSPAASSTAAPTSSSPPPGSPGSAPCRRPRTPAGSPSAWTPTRTRCSRERC